MSLKKHLWADLLFGVQILGAVLFFGPRAIRAMSVAQGVSLGEPISILAFALVNLSLAWSARRASPSRIASQIVWAFQMYTILILMLIVCTLANPNFSWKENDTTTVVIAFAGGLITGLGGWFLFRAPLTDPIVKGVFCIFLKAIPHFMWGLRIADEGSAGVPLVTIVVGHFTILVRLIQILMAVRQEGWSKNRVGQLIGEGSAELTWTVATCIWVAN